MWGWVWGWRVPMFDKLNNFRSSFSRCNLVCSKEDTQLNARKQKITQTFALGNINAHFYHSCFFFFFFYHPELTQCRAVLTSSLIGFIPSFLSSPHLPSFLRRCFPTECGVVTPLLGWCSNSRPCDCAQESEDCITACGERPQEWTEGGAAGKREIKSRERSQQMRGKRRGESDDRRWVYRCKKWRASQEGMEMRHVLFMWKYVRAKMRDEEWGLEGMQSVGCRGETGPAELLWRSK